MHPAMKSKFQKLISTYIAFTNLSFQSHLRLPQRLKKKNDNYSFFAIIYQDIIDTYDERKDNYIRAWLENPITKILSHEPSLMA